MWPFPSDRFELVSPMALDQAVAALRADLVNKPRSWWSPPPELFAGKADRDGFRISQSFLGGFSLLIEGRFDPGPDGLRINVTQRYSRRAAFLVGFTLLFLSVYVVALARVAFIELAKASYDFPMWPTVVIIAILAWLAFDFCRAVLRKGFWAEARHTKRHLLCIFDAREGN